MRTGAPAMQRIGVTAAASTVKVLARGYDRLRPAPCGVTVLLYHRVGAGTGSRVDLSARVFAEQLSELAERFNVLTLDQALARLDVPSGDHSAPSAGVVLTFDDGTADFAEVALPLLVERHIPVTLYVATGFVEESKRWPDGCLPLSWGALRDILDTSLVTLGSHTHEHLLLDRCQPGTVAADLDRSVAILQDRLGVSAQHFAYPKAVPPTPANEALVRQRFVSAALAGNRVNVPGGDPHRLHRTPIQTADAGSFFTAKAKGGMRLEASLRELANRVRYRGASQ